jgi:molybdate transport repressor ModE-like protein
MLFAMKRFSGMSSLESKPMARSLDVDWQDDAGALRSCYKRQRDRQDRTRVHLLWLLRKGHSMKEAAEAVGVGYRTAGRWVEWYRSGGLEEVLSRRHGGSGGRPARLSESEQEALLEKARAGEVRTIWDGVEWAREQADAGYTYWGMRHVFERIGLSKKVPRPQSPKADPEEQSAWKKGT